MSSKNNFKSFIAFIGVIIVFFVIPYYWRQYRDSDIKEHSQYTFGRITKKSGSLKNGNHWHYQFMYNGKSYESYRSTHVDYNVSIGDYFLVNFSSEQPTHNKVLYEYRLKTYQPEVVHQVWDTVPLRLVESSRK